MRRGLDQLVRPSRNTEDGSENSATEELIWDDEGDDVLTLTRDYLRPNQSVTLRWTVTCERT